MSTELNNARSFLEENGNQGYLFKKLSSADMDFFPPIPANDKTERFLDAIAVDGSSGAVVYEVAREALREANEASG